MSRSQRIAVAGLDFIPDLSGALFAPDFGALLVADLHLEKGTSLARRGVHLPPYDTRESLNQLRAVIDATRPQRLIFLGDSFHDSAGAGRLPPQALALLQSLTAQVRWTWVTGNHDPAPAHHHGGAVVDEAVVDGIVLRHEADPAELRPELSGHFHPKLRVRVRGRHVSRRCFVASATKIVLPAFGALTGGLDAAHPEIARAMGGRGEALVPVDNRLLRFALAA